MYIHTIFLSTVHIGLHCYFKMVANRTNIIVVRHCNHCLGENVCETFAKLIKKIIRARFNKNKIYRHI